MKMKKNKVPYRSGGPKKPIVKASASDEHKQFGSRRELDEYTAKILCIKEEFQDDLRSIREFFLIPVHLEPYRDAHVSYIIKNIDSYDDIFCGRFTHELLNEENLARFKKAIVWIIKKHNLGMNFYMWVQWYILYREPFPGGVPLNHRFFEQCKKDIGEFFRILKNGQEIKCILSFMRSIIGVSRTGRVTDEYSHGLKSVKVSLNKKRLKIRKPRVNHNIDIEVVKRHGRTELFEGKPVKNTYLTLVAELLSDASEDYIKKEDDMLSAQMLGKRKNRLLKRIKELDS